MDLLAATTPLIKGRTSQNNVQPCLDKLAKCVKRLCRNECVTHIAEMRDVKNCGRETVMRPEMAKWPIINVCL